MSSYVIVHNTYKGEFILPNINYQKVIRACHLSFQGTPDSKISSELEVHPATISRWRQLSLWKQTEESIIEKTIDQELNQDSATEDVE